MKTEALYIHIPFCEHICTYCDFAKVFYNQGIADRYLSILSEEIESLPEKNFKTIYIGGGTPSALNYYQLSYLFEILKPLTDNNLKEFTIEVNPESMSVEKLKLLKKSGINRLSVGIQTFNDDLLEKIGRKHTSLQAQQFIKQAFEFIDNISIDMMYGLPDQKKSDLFNDLSTIENLPVKHISYYSLILEDHTILKNSRFVPLDSEVEYQWNRMIYEVLSNQGFHQYEVSNYAKGNYESIHNKVYWHYENYYGLGVGASGKIDDLLITHSRALNRYLKGKDITSIQKLTKKDTMFNHLMMSLRLVEGLNIKDFNKRYHENFLNLYRYPIAKHLALNNLIIKDDYIKTTDQGMYILNTVLIDFLED
ncbi:putative oxygen-independent coproporphyrinogen III oxidase [Eggerthia catenaformis OT 569 = DSM 20559]|uniref:Heme chaperone HemW n=1 Tax=Eggerthia catenaformis OT 569 = DSM 20559 TaxID=999415 RepID=M2Q1H4_9FIRM|nr:radical SAM family heme chaperone HemW [Eggerthia catenaformis]EMD16126.1 putative oxygen-independent coproporphyrinogen III oxidase [Eggerthia catenaformis OT 569 = DSM 20559]OUC51750.1 coproporphyrinogen III oxidase [Eggerthia catenaformis]